MPKKGHKKYVQMHLYTSSESDSNLSGSESELELESDSDFELENDTRKSSPVKNNILPASLSIKKKDSKKSETNKNISWLWTFIIIVLVILCGILVRWLLKYRKVGKVDLFSMGQALMTASSNKYEVQPAS